MDIGYKPTTALYNMRPAPKGTRVCMNGTKKKQKIYMIK